MHLDMVLKMSFTNTSGDVCLVEQYRFASPFELLLMMIGLVCAIIQGSALQGPYVLMSDTIDNYARSMWVYELSDEECDSNVTMRLRDNATMYGCFVNIEYPHVVSLDEKSCQFIFHPTPCYYVRLNGRDPLHIISAMATSSEFQQGKSILTQTTESLHSFALE